jgi:DNA-binding MarR family transcriptional regulator
MTVLLHQLERSQWVKRSVHTENRSANLVHITARGRLALRVAGRAFVTRIEAALEGLPAGEVASLDRALAPLVGLWTDEIRAHPSPKRLDRPAANRLRHDPMRRRRR